jgi:hypothetical protein
MDLQAEHITSQYGKFSVYVQYTNECSDPVSVAKWLKNQWPNIGIAQKTQTS